MKGIDVSSYQSAIDWNKAKADGVTFAILKIIDKAGKPDKRFEQNYQDCLRENIPVGVYNYSYAAAAEKAEEDARRVLSVLAGRTLRYRVWLDVEDGCLQGKGAALIEIIESYRTVIESEGCEFGVYTYLDFYNQNIKTYSSDLDCPFWVARYPTGRQMSLTDEPAADRKPQIENTLWGWQYTSSGKVAGISGPVDLDQMYEE